MKSMLDKHMQEVPDIEYADTDVVERFENKFKVLSNEKKIFNYKFTFITGAMVPLLWGWDAENLSFLPGEEIRSFQKIQFPKGRAKN